MTRVARAIVACASFAVFTAGTGAFAAAPPLSLTAFGAAPLSTYELSASGIAARALADDLRNPSRGFDVAGASVLPAAYGSAAPSGFAASLAVSPMLALDSGYNLDIAARFANYDRLATPLLDGGSSFLALADGGRYAGVTYVPAPNLRLRLGASTRDDRRDSFAFDAVAATGLPPAFEASQTNAMLAGVSWDFSDWAALGINAISANRSGVPLGYPGAASLTDNANTTALGVSARFGLGAGWVTTADYAQGFTQLNQRSGGGAGGTEQTQSYSITVAKHGVFGDDAVGFSLSRPAAGIMGSFASLTASGDLPPMIIAHGQAEGATAPETDFQLGYVTSFLGGKLALQTNAAYQLNVQGQTGATAVSMISRAKIKF